MKRPRIGIAGSWDYCIVDLFLKRHRVVAAAFLFLQGFGFIWHHANGRRVVAVHAGLVYLELAWGRA